MSAQVAQDLRAAADVLRRDGWTQDNYTNNDGRHCVIGALATALGDPHCGFETNNALDEHRGAIAAVVGKWPAPWNDEPGRTAAEVIAALEAAADAAEAQS